MLITDKSTLEKFSAPYRLWQGVPGIAVTKKGRIFVAFYTGGTHEGIIRYTVGQRKGLGVSLGKPAFVTAIDPTANTVSLTLDEKKIFTDRLVCRDLSFMSLIPGDYTALPVEGKVRYAARPERAAACIKGDAAQVFFERPVRAVTPGQSVVFYDGDRILFGGTIV